MHSAVNPMATKALPLLLLLTALCAPALLAALPSASAAPAAPQGLPPTMLHATAGAGGTAVLAWDPPLDAAGPLAYDVYAGGVLLATVQAPTYTVPAGTPTLYSVTALDGSGESAPAIILVWQAGLAPAPSGCPPLSTAVYTYWPFVAVAVNWECLPIQP